MNNEFDYNKKCSCDKCEETIIENMKKEHWDWYGRNEVYNESCFNCGDLATMKLKFIRHNKN